MIKELCQKLAEPLRSRAEGEPLDGLTELFALWGELSLEAYEGKRPNAWIGEFFPTEICKIFDLNPIHIEGLICLPVMEGIGSGIIDRAVEYTLSRDPCTFQLGALAGIFDRILPEPAAMLRANHSCVGREKQFQSASMLYGKPYHYIDLPNNLVDATEEYVTRQMAELFRKLEAQFGPMATPSRIEEVFAHSNRIRQNCLRINELRKERTLPIDPRTMFFVNPVIAGYLEPSQRLADLSEKIYQELAALKEDAGKEEKIRLFLMLAPFLFPSQPFYDWLVGEMGVHFVFEEQSHIYWRPLDPADPFRSLARKCLDMDWVGPLSRRVAAADRLVDEYRAQGVLFTSIWGCRHLIGGVQLIRKHFAQRGIPCLNLDVDLGDERNVDFASVQSRIEEFLEIVRR